MIMYLIFFLIFLLAAVFAFTVGFLINFHFKKLGVENDTKAQKIIRVYKIGTALIFLLSAVSLFLLII